MNLANGDDYKKQGTKLYTYYGATYKKVQKEAKQKCLLRNAQIVKLYRKINK